MGGKRQRCGRILLAVGIAILLITLCPPKYIFVFIAAVLCFFGIKLLVC